MKLQNPDGTWTNGENNSMAIIGKIILNTLSILNTWLNTACILGLHSVQKNYVSGTENKKIVISQTLLSIFAIQLRINM